MSYGKIHSTYWTDDKIQKLPDAAKLLDALSWEGRRSAAFLGMLNRAVASQVKLNATDVETLGVLAVTGPVTPTRLGLRALQRTERAGPAWGPLT